MTAAAAVPLVSAPQMKLSISILESTLGKQQTKRARAGEGMRWGWLCSAAAARVLTAFDSIRLLLLLRPVAPPRFTRFRASARTWRMHTMATTQKDSLQSTVGSAHACADSEGDSVYALRLSARWRWHRRSSSAAHFVCMWLWLHCCCAVDGHGGARCSSYAAQNLHELIFKVRPPTNFNFEFEWGAARRMA